MGPKREYVEEVGDENMMPPGVEYEDDDDKQLPVALSAYAQGRATPITAGVYNPLSVHSILKKRRTGKEKGASTWRSVHFSRPSHATNPPLLQRRPLLQLRPPRPPPPTEEEICKYRGVKYIFSAPVWPPSDHRYVLTDRYNPKRTTQFNSTQRERYEQFMYDPKPLLPRTMRELEGRHIELSDLARSWAEKYFTPLQNRLPMTSTEMKIWGEKNPLLVRWIDSVACAHNVNWLHIFYRARHLLAMGVMGKVLEDRVFKDSCFGGSRQDRHILDLIDDEVQASELVKIKNEDLCIMSDALSRQKARATFIDSGFERSRGLPERFAKEITRLFRNLVDLLEPLLPTEEGEYPDLEYYKILDQIVALAAKLSLDMRREPDTLYHVAITPPRYQGVVPDRMSPVIYHHEEREPKDSIEFGKYSNIISVWPGVYAYKRLSPHETSYRTVSRALIFSKLDKPPDTTEIALQQNPEKITMKNQLWEYLSVLGVLNSGDGRNWEK